jgi:hypothetical protein
MPSWPGSSRRVPAVTIDQAGCTRLMQGMIGGGGMREPDRIPVVNRGRTRRPRRKSVPEGSIFFLIYP